MLFHSSIDNTIVILCDWLSCHHFDVIRLATKIVDIVYERPPGLLLFITKSCVAGTQASKTHRIVDW